jgi:succinate dehydrogenase / fumarate reductase membrane anchor subunit
MKSTSDLRSKLGKAKGLGSAKHGVSHWWLQRVTAVALVPLSVWFVYSLMTVMLSDSAVKVAQWFASPVNAVTMILLLAALFWHAKLGLQVVIEDYVHRPFSKYALLLANVFISFTFAAVSILAVLRLHFLDIAAGAL